MKIHEYQGKQLFKKFGVKVLENRVARTADEAAEAFRDLAGPVAVVKAQIHAAVAAKARLPRIRHNMASSWSNRPTKPSRPPQICWAITWSRFKPAAEGKAVNQVIVEAGCDIARELYLGIVLDRSAHKPVLMCSQEGGVEIEKVAHETPEKIFKEHFDPAQGIESFQVRKLCKKLGITGKSVRAADKFMKALCRLYVDLDCSLMEINPLVITGDGELVAFDSKINFDSNAMFRHKEWKKCATCPRKRNLKFAPPMPA